MRTSTDKALGVGTGAAAVIGGVAVALGSVFVALFVLGVLFMDKGLDDEPAAAEAVAAEPEQYRLHDLGCRSLDRAGETGQLELSGQLTNPSDETLDLVVRVQPRGDGRALGAEQSIRFTWIEAGDTVDWKEVVVLDDHLEVDPALVTCDYRVDLGPNSSD